MGKEIYEKIIKKRVEGLKRGKYVIYGTKEIGLIYYNELVNKLGEDSIAFFIDGRKETNLFKGKPVYRCNEIPEEDINEYKYIVGTVSRIALFVENLIVRGVRRENIINTVNYFSSEFIDMYIKKINDIYIYPPINDKQILEKLVKQLNNFLIVPKNYKNQVVLNYSGEVDIKIPCGYKICNEMLLENLHEDDIVLIWNIDNVVDKKIEKLKNVFCFDDRAVRYLTIRVLLAVMQKFVDEKSQEYYARLSLKNFKQLCINCAKYDNVIVCGTGPSIHNLNKNLTELVKKASLIVCNGFYKLEQVFKHLNPKAYVLHDYIYLSVEKKDEMDNIVDYVIRNQTYLCVDERWIKMCCIRYPQLEKYIIGLERIDYNMFPSEDQLVYITSENVITSIGLSIASSLGENIFILGCDGGSWLHAYKDDNSQEKAFESREITFLHQELSDNFYEYSQKLNGMYKNILEFGESKGKRYRLLAHSEIEEIEKRYYTYTEK